MNDNNPIYLNRSELEELIRKLGENNFKNFKFGHLKDIGKQKRCEFIADDISGKLDFYYNKNGTTTILPTGNEESKKIATILKNLIVNNSYTHTNENKNFSYEKYSHKSFNSLLSYLEDNVNINKTREPAINDKVTIHYYTSTYGDHITISYFNNETLLVQGKPVYLFNEILSFIHFSPDISIKQVIDAENTYYDASITIDDAEKLLKNKIRKYDSLNEDIIKMLISSYVMLNSSINILPEYTSYAFPALRSLEPFLKTVLSKFNIYDEFQVIFEKTNDNQFAVSLKYSKIINNVNAINFIEKIYDYYHKNRHTYFHGNPNIGSIPFIETRTEAEEIINEVINLINETSNCIYL